MQRSPKRMENLGIFIQPAPTSNANSNWSLTSSRRNKIIYDLLMFFMFKNHNVFHFYNLICKNNLALTILNKRHIMTTSYFTYFIQLFQNLSSNNDFGSYKVLYKQVFELSSYWFISSYQVIGFFRAIKLLIFFVELKQNFILVSLNF